MNAQNKPFYISGREKTNPPSQVSPLRYQFISLKDTEPNLGVPLTNAIPASATWVLTTDALGNRYFATTLLYDSTYSTFKGTSSNFVSVFTTVQRTSGNWQSTYTTLNQNSGTWLTVTSANSLYFKTSGGTIEGDIKVQGNVLIVGSLSALSGLEFITTRATTTSSLSIVNVGIGPALYVSQDGFYDIAKFYDAEGGIAMLIGNITPPGAYTGVVGIRTEYPNKTLTVVGDISSSQGFYTEGPIVSAGVTLDTIIYNAVPPTLQSVFTTVSSNSAKWETVYADWRGTSASYVSFKALSTQMTYLCAAEIAGNVTVFGNLVALGSAFFTNTIVSVTSALSVVNVGAGPALFVSQGKGSGDVASFYDTDYGDEVLHVGNAVDLNGQIKDGVIGIKTGAPNKTLTVVGEISSTSFINETLILYKTGNVLVGRNINKNIAGIDNVIVGDSAGFQTDFGTSNVFVGHNAGRNVIDGSYNVLIGDNAGLLVTQGTSNVLIGNNPAPNIQTGNFNIGIGTSTLLNSTIAGYNIGIGTGAGGNLVTGNYNIFIGAQNTSNDTSRSLVIGNNARATKDFQAVIGDPTFPFVDGIYYGNMSFYGATSAAQCTVEGISALRDSRFRHSTIDTNLRVNQNLFVGGNTVINSALSSIDGTVRITGSLSVSGNQTITGALSVTTLSATNIIGFYSLLPYQTFTGNGVQTDFTLLSAARTINDLMVFVSGVYQSKTFFTLVNQFLLRFAVAPPPSSLIEVVYQRPAQIPFSILPLPGDATIQTPMLANRIVTSDKIAINGVSGVNIDVKQITPDKLSQGGPGWNYNFVTNQNNLSANNLNITNFFTAISATLSSLSAQDVIQATTILPISSFVLPSFGITRRGQRIRGSQRYNTDAGAYESFYPFEFNSNSAGVVQPGWYGNGFQLIGSYLLTSNWSSANIIWGTTSSVQYHNYFGYRIEAFYGRGSTRMRNYIRFIGATGSVDTGANYWTGGRWSNNNTGDTNVFNNGSNATGISYAMGSIYNGDANYWWAGAGNTGMTQIIDIRTNGYSSGHWQGYIYSYMQSSYAYGASSLFHLQYQNPISSTFNGTTFWPIIGVHTGWQEGSIPAYSGRGGNTRINVYGIAGWEVEQNYE